MSSHAGSQQPSLPEPAEGSPGLALSPKDRVFPINRIASTVAALSDEGIPASHALESLHFSEADLTSPHARVSLSDVIQCYHNAIRLSADRFVAYRAGLRIHVSGLGLYGFAMLCSMDGHQAVRFALKYHALATSLVTLAFHEEKGHARFTAVPLALPEIDAQLYRFIVENFFGNVVSVMKDIFGQSFGPSELRVMYHPPFESGEYAPVFGCPVHFDEAENSIVFGESWLKRPPALADQVTHLHLASLCDQLLNKLRLHGGTAGKVREVILLNRAHHMGSDEVARRLNLAPRSLRRRLDDEHTSFQKVRNELRAEVAISYLRDTDLSLEDIAALLGFGDAASFRRAFRRWTNTTPGRFRYVGPLRPR